MNDPIHTSEVFLIRFLNLTGTLEIGKELEISMNPNKEERKAAHGRLLQEQGYDERFAVLDECRSREVLWFYTGQGPFRSYLGKVGLAPSLECRFCGADLESPEHLVYSCKNFEHLQIDHLDLDALCAKVKLIVIEIYKLPS